MDSEPSFRAIVVGAGVTGLITSHILQAAGIPHVVLERRSVIAPLEGASIAIYPHGARILYQLGLYEKVKAACVPCKWWYSRGTDVMDMTFFLLERREFLQIIYDHLPDKSCIRLNCSIKDIKEHVSDVEVVLSDGTVEKGDIVIGADGAYSTTRRLMWQHANSVSSSLMPVTAKEKTSIVTSWKCLIGMAPGMPEMGERDMTVVHNDRYSFLVLTQPNMSFFFVFFRLKKPFTWPRKERYSDWEAEELAQSVADHPISDTLVFGELWKRRIRGQLISLEEGVLKHWHHGRIVLVGDSVHKVTPNIALGGNSAMESAVVLCNHLRRMVKEHEGAKSSRATLQRVFEMYQREREPRMKEIMEFSSLITKIQAWDTPWLKFLATWVLPYQSDRKIADQMGEMISRAPRLDWIDTSGFQKGRLEWKQGWMKTEETNRTKRTRHPATLLTNLIQVSGVMVFFIVVYSTFG